ncbi:LysR family transcriptional regulator [Actinomadura parmotrematis]|uniref:LysR family transcriptional regulator n=1 Tax=Actinomadura parmotrematis TaxID=2864039 RepID=A0ABS7G1R1_9ACTN|nr:LysR family transcriptional regulator [Actinomadura parmotrematis]MBW8485772.1 LysR family transcriptional regulator [Actinomadura parmotrematis]
MQIDAVRTFAAIADASSFQDAADDLEISQQAVSKRVAGLERDLGVRLFARTARGAQLTADGLAFLPHARALLRAAERAEAAVRPGGRALRIDVVGRKLAPAELVRGFHAAYPDARIDVATPPDAAAAVAAVAAGTLDAALRAVTAPARLPDGVASARVHDEPVQLLVGASHPLATAPAARPADLAAHRVWLPGIVPGTEWAAYYDDLAAAFGFTIETAGADFGAEPLLETVARDPALATLIGEGTQLFPPPGLDLRRVPLRDPTPVYPHSLVWREDNPHPTLAALRAYLTPRTPSPVPSWTPAWTH